VGQSEKFRRQALILFIAVGLFPALVVSALWYSVTRNTPGSEVLGLGGIVVPIAIIGLMPAIILGIAFAELLSRPIKLLAEAIEQIRQGNLAYRTHFRHGSEFADMAESLNEIASSLQAIVSQQTGETELVSAERNKLRAVLDSMEDGVFAIDRSGRIMLFNKAAQELTGRTMTEVAGQLSEKVMPFRRQGELVMASWLADRRVAKREQGEWRNLQLYRADGESLYVDVRAVKLPDDPNGIKALVTFHDLTKSHNLEELKVDFVSLAAHELRTPITTIKGYLDVLALELGDDTTPEQKDILARTTQSAKHLSGVVNNLLNISHIERGDLALNFQQIDLLELITNLATDYATRATTQQLKLKLELPKHLSKLRIDEVGITEVINNLVDNAMTHTREGGSVVISVHENGAEAEVLVRDTGSGMPAEALPKLFTKFYRVEGMNTTHGTGLGLFISKAIVEAHGGHIWVDSQLGRGSTFGFRLPVAPLDLVEDNATKEPQEKAHGWLKKHTIR
jgi:two-component system, OmpR family, phosphate regulon sensor histidine kinase PhoR